MEQIKPVVTVEYEFDSRDEKHCTFKIFLSLTLLVEETKGTRFLEVFPVSTRFSIANMMEENRSGG